MTTKTKPRGLTLEDRCDSCSAAAKVVATPLTLARALEASKTVRRGGPPASINPQARQAGAVAAYLANQQGQTQ